MKKALLLVLALIAIAPVAVEAQQDLDELVRQGDTYLKRGLIRRNTLRPYTGDVIQYEPSYCMSYNRLDGGGCREWTTAPNSEITKRGSLRDGRWHGPYEQWFAAGPPVQRALRGQFNMGERCGEWGILNGYAGDPYEPYGDFPPC